VQAALDAAAAEMSPSIFGHLFDEAQMYLAAHKLNVSPFGKDARLEDDSKKTSDLIEFRRIARLVSPRVIVT
jgi:hypothetical protein